MLARRGLSDDEGEETVILFEPLLFLLNLLSIKPHLWSSHLKHQRCCLLVPLN